MPEVIQMPKLGFDMAEGTLNRWVLAEGEAVQKGNVLAEIETDKATVEVESSYSGIVYRHLVEEGDIVPIGTPIAVITQPGEEVKDLAALTGKEEKKAPEAAKVPVEAAPAAQPEKAAELPPTGGRLKVSPLARRLASEFGLDLRRVKGSGTGGRIVREDVEAAIQAAPTAAAAVPAAPTAPAAGSAPVEKPQVVLPLPVLASAEAPADEIVQVNRLRAAIGRRLVESKQQVPHFYLTHEYPFEEVLRVRKEVNAALPDSEKISVNDFILKAVALALRQYPNLNASLKDDQIVRHGHINLGVAVAVEGGLLTVVCRDTDMKPLRLISAEVKQMAARARQGKVRTEDIEGSTFSISNLGMFDVENFAAIINPPEAAILAVSAAKQVPVVVDGALAVGLRMKATISVDHRVSDGAEAAQFMQALEQYFLHPLRLLL